MRSWIFRGHLALAVTLLLASLQSLSAQIVLNEATMASEALAETDAGSQYNYVIDNLDELDSFGPYTYVEYGEAPGYNSEASVGTVHFSDFASDDADYEQVAGSMAVAYLEVEGRITQDQ